MSQIATIGKEMSLHSKVTEATATWTVTWAEDDHAFPKEFQIRVVGAGTRKITNIQYRENRTAGAFKNLNLSKGFSPNWFSTNAILYVHCLYNENHELVLKFDYSIPESPCFEYYNDHISDPRPPTSHGRGGGGN